MLLSMAGFKQTHNQLRSFTFGKLQTLEPKVNIKNNQHSVPHTVVSLGNGI